VIDKYDKWRYRADEGGTSMTITELRDVLDRIEQMVEKHDYDAIPAVIAEAKRELAEDRYVTTTQAKELLGIGSVNTVKAMVVKGEIHGTVRHGNRTMIPLSEVQRLQESEIVRGIRASDRAHDASAMLGNDAGMSDEELDILSASRPGTLPWKREHRSAPCWIRARSIHHVGVGNCSNSPNVDSMSAFGRRGSSSS
jgi:hypothetical protein